MRAPRARCGECGRSFAEDDTALVFGRRAGSYKRGNARARRRVCRWCVARHVQYVRNSQATPNPAKLEHSYYDMRGAAEQFGIPTDDLWRNEYDRASDHPNAWPARCAGLPEGYRERAAAVTAELLDKPDT